MKNVRCNTLSRGEGATKGRVKNSGRTAKFQPGTDLKLLTRIPHPVSLRSPTFPPGEGMRCALLAEMVKDCISPLDRDFTQRSLSVKMGWTLRPAIHQTKL